MNNYENEDKIQICKINKIVTQLKDFLKMKYAKYFSTLG